MHKLRIATKKGKIEDSLMMHNMTQLPEALFHLLHNFPFTLDLTFRFLHNFYNYPIIAKVMLQKVGSCFLTITFPKSYPGCEVPAPRRTVVLNQEVPGCMSDFLLLCLPYQSKAVGSIVQTLKLPGLEGLQAHLPLRP